MTHVWEFNGINHLPIGAGFLPSTVSVSWRFIVIKLDLVVFFLVVVLLSFNFWTLPIKRNEDIYNWLVVSTPLKKSESQWEGLSHIWKIKNV